MAATLIDTHAHIFYKDYHDQLDAVLERAAQAGVDTIICVGLDVPTSEQAITLAETYPNPAVGGINVWATVGVHPHEAENAPADHLKRLEELASHEKVVAIGEMGLDYFRNISPPDVQQGVFQGQLELARSLELPAVVHNREADDDLMAILRKVGHGNGVVHCFSSPPAFAGQVIDFGFHISFTGTVTYPKSNNAAVLREVGLERVMVETDCPYLAPAPQRGKTNEPAFVRHTAAKIAEICGLTLDQVAAQTTANARRLFTRMHGA